MTIEEAQRQLNDLLAPLGYLPVVVRSIDTDGSIAYLDEDGQPVLDAMDAFIKDGNVVVEYPPFHK